MFILRRNRLGVAGLIAPALLAPVLTGLTAAPAAADPKPVPAPTATPGNGTPSGPTVAPAPGSTPDRIAITDPAATSDPTGAPAPGSPTPSGAPSAVPSTGVTPSIGAAPTTSGSPSPSGNPDWKVPRLTVMPLGDSITRGVGSSTGAGYRADLRNQLTPHAGAVQFVGSVTTDGAQHEGHSGWQIEDLAENIDGWLSVSRPNVVLLNIGTNDMDLGTDVAGAPARLGALVDRITDAAPDVTVLVSSIVPNANADRNKRVVAYNAAIPQLVAERRGKGLHVGFVDMNAVTTGDLADRLHPNDAGFAKMAGAFTKGVAQAAADGWIREVVNARTAPLRDQPIADYNVDLDGDHHADYLVVQSNGAVDAWRNNNIGDSAGGWSGYGRIAGGVGAPGRNIRFADINGDGKADYLAVSDNGAVDAWINKSSGSTHDNWSSWGRIAGGVGAPGRNIRFADINGDGKADFVTVDDKGAVNAWINQLSDKAHDKWDGWGTLASGVGAAGKNVRFADINGDGRADYVALDDNGAARAWLKKDGRDSWSNYGLIASGVGEPADAVRFSDVDGDGKADYVTVQDQGSLRAWGNQGGDPGNGWRSYGRIAGGVAASFRIRI